MSTVTFGSSLSARSATFVGLPKQVDRHERRREIAAAVVRVVGERGLQGVTFREVAAEAGVSVALVQHYFGTKDNLLIETLDMESARLAAGISGRLDQLGPDAGLLEQITAEQADAVLDAHLARLTPKAKSGR